MSAVPIFSEFQSAFRTLRRAPGFSALVIGLLAFGLGANVAVFSIFEAIVLSPLPYPEADRLVGLSSVNATKALDQPALSAADFRDVRERARSFPALAAYRPEFVGYRPDGGEARQLVGALVTEEFFAVFRANPTHGRVFRADEFSAAAPRTAVLSAAAWRRHFGGRPDVIGTTVTLERQPTTIVGIMPEGFREPEFVDLWLPFPPESGENLARDSRFWTTVGRLGAGVAAASARAELATIARALEAEYPAVNRGWSFRAEPLLEQRVGSLRRSLLLLVGAVGLVLLVACVNLANLLLARGLRQMPQLALKLALGATPGALARGVWAEAMLLALAGGAMGTALAAAGLPLLVRGLPAGLIPRTQEIGLDGAALGFALGATALTGLLCGSLPAWQVRRTNLAELLQSAGARGTPGGFTGKAQTALVALQLALTLTVLAAAGGLARTLFALQATATGFSAANVLTVRIAGGQDAWAQPADLARYYDRLLAELQATPGIEAAAINASAPLSGITLRYPFWVQGRPRTEGNADEAVFASVSPDYLRALRIPLRQGRFIEARDDFQAPRVCVINETLARRIFPDRDPIGQKIQTLPWLNREYREIVGVVADTRQDNLSDPPPPQLYVPAAQSPWFFTTYLVKTAPGTGAATVQAALRRADPAVAMTVRSLEDNIALTTTQPRLRAWLLGVFAAAALGLSAFGLYASMAFAVNQRTREFGIRLALGATPAGIVALVLGRAGRVAAAGVILGLAGAVGTERILQATVPGLVPLEGVGLAGLAALLAAVALAAGALPAWTASRLNPVRALQHD